MNIVHLIYDDPQNPWCGGGGAIRTFEINKRLAERHRIVVITGSWPGARDEVLEGVQFYRVGNSRNYLLSRLTYAINAHRMIRRFPCDLLVNDFSGYSPVFPRPLTQSPIITVKHHIMGRHSFGKNPLMGIFPYLFEKLDLQLNRHFVSVSPGLTKHIQQKYGSSKNVQTIYNGISDELFELEPEEDSFILFIGRMDVYMKGLDILIESFSRISDPTMTLKLAGVCSPKNEKKLKNLAEKYNVASRIEMLGYIDKEKKSELFRTCQFVCMPSRFEGWGIVAIEAAAAGKPVIGTRISGLSDAIIPNKTGILVSSENSEELTAAMNQLLGDEKLRQKMGLAGRVWARHFNWDEIAQKQEMFYYLVENGYSYK